MDIHEIEKKWQDIWEKEKRFEVKNHVEGKENKYRKYRFICFCLLRKIKCRQVRLWIAIRIRFCYS